MGKPIATLLIDMSEYLNSGSFPYPLWEPIEDTQFWLRLEQTMQIREDNRAF